MSKKTGKERSKRFSIPVYFGSEEELERVKAAAGGSASAYIRDCVRFSHGYADPRHDVARELYAVARKIGGEVHLIADLVRATYALRRAIGQTAFSSATHDVLGCLDRVNDLIDVLTVSIENRAGLDVELIRLIGDYRRDCAAWESRQSRRATGQARKARS